MFDGVQGSGFMGDIAIDDLLVTDGVCTNTTALPPTGITLTTAVTFRKMLARNLLKKFIVQFYHKKIYLRMLIDNV